MMPVHPTIYTSEESQVLCQWLMDQVPLGNKAPRPGYARQVWCPACRGLLDVPLALTSGHVLLECMAVEGTENLMMFNFILEIIQVLVCVKESGHSWKSVCWKGGVRRPLTTCS